MATPDKSDTSETETSSGSVSHEASRYRFSVPVRDESVERWIAEQSTLSHSLRQIIREAIERDGFVDVTCRPVKQLPRRGRPPQDSATGSEPEPEKDDDKAPRLLDMSLDDDDEDLGDEPIGEQIARSRSGNRRKADSPEQTTYDPPLAGAEQKAPADAGDADDDDADDTMGSLFSKAIGR